MKTQLGRGDKRNKAGRLKPNKSAPPAVNKSGAPGIKYPLLIEDGFRP